MALEDVSKEFHSDEEVLPLSEVYPSNTRHDRPTARRHTWRARSIIAVGISILLIATNIASALLNALALLGAAHNTKLRSLPPIRPGREAKFGAPNSWFGGDCGDSPVTARARGCHFNTVLYAWLPPKCLMQEDYDDEATFYADNDFQWSSASTMLPITHEQALTGTATSVLTSMEWHATHCTYVWQRLHRSLINGTAIDSYTADYHHTTHCQEMIRGMMRNDTMAQNPTHVITKYPTCN
jgi:hypothetical protein